MKRFFYMFLMLCPLCAFATDMCARDDTMVLVFDTAISRTTGINNSIEKTWTEKFSYGTFSGEATCLSAAEGLGRTTGQGAYYGTGEYANTLITAETGLSGLDANENERKYCWCRMTHPFLTPWVFNRDMGNSCADGGCPSICAYSSNMLIRILRELGGSWHNDL